MDPTSFGMVKGEVQRLPFKDDKVKAIAYAQGYFYAEQVGELMREFGFDDDRLRGLQACVGKMLPATCAVLVLTINDAITFPLFHSNPVLSHFLLATGFPLLWSSC